MNSTPSTYKLKKSTVLLLALIAGFSVANMYYIQPLLDTVTQDFHITDGAAGFLVTISQLGYAVGLMFLVPLGDIVPRKSIITIMMSICAITLVITYLAPSYFLLASILVLVGVTSSTAMIVVPFAASLADPSERGKITGNVMSGVFLGILLARTLSGVVAEIFNWRTVFLLSAIIILILTFAAWKQLPHIRPEGNKNYARLLSSVFTIIKKEPVLRSRMILGFFNFFVFTALWTCIAFMLSRVYHYNEAIIGLFGLVGAAGAAAAPIAGKWSDKGYLHHVTTVAWISTLVSWIFIYLGGNGGKWIWALILGLIVIDFGVQSSHISNQNAVYSLSPDERSRITTAYMVSTFIGGIIGSLTIGFVYQYGGWKLVCIICALVSLLALISWAFFRNYIEKHHFATRAVQIE